MWGRGACSEERQRRERGEGEDQDEHDARGREAGRVGRVHGWRVLGKPDQFLDSRKDLAVVCPPAGTIVFPRLLTGAVDRLCALLREKYETTVVPGKFFEMPEHFRLGIGGETEMTCEGLNRLAAALDELDG